MAGKDRLGASGQGVARRRVTWNGWSGVAARGLFSRAEAGVEPDGKVVWCEASLVVDRQQRSGKAGRVLALQ